MWVDERGSEVLDLGECRRLLALGAKDRLVGHVGFLAGSAVLVLPLDYAVAGPDVLVEVGGGLFSRLADKPVAFEVEGFGTRMGGWGSGGGAWWSVLVRGPAVEEDAGSGGRSDPQPRVARPGRHLVRIRADVVTGRRFHPQADLPVRLTRGRGRSAKCVTPTGVPAPPPLSSVGTSAV